MSELNFEIATQSYSQNGRTASEQAAN